MAKAKRGTILTINADFKAADDALVTVQTFFRDNPTFSPNRAIAEGHGEMFKIRDRAWRKATGSKNTLVHCPCRIVNPHITADLRTACCGSTTVEVNG